MLCKGIHKLREKLETLHEMTVWICFLDALNNGKWELSVANAGTQDHCLQIGALYLVTDFLKHTATMAKPLEYFGPI